MTVTSIKKYAKDLREEAEIAEENALVKSEAHMMVNLATALGLLFGAEISLLSAIIGLSARDDVDITSSANISGVAAVATVFAIASTMVGLCSAIFFQILARQVKKGHATMWLMHPSAATLQRLPILAVPVSCGCIVIGLICSVCGHYGKHWSAAVAAFILAAALLGCVWAMSCFYDVQKACKEDMHLIANYKEKQELQKQTDNGDGAGEDEPLVPQGDGGTAQNARR